MFTGIDGNSFPLVNHVNYKCGAQIKNGDNCEYILDWSVHCEIIKVRFELIFFYFLFLIMGEMVVVCCSFFDFLSSKLPKFSPLGLVEPAIEICVIAFVIFGFDDDTSPQGFNYI